MAANANESLAAAVTLATEFAQTTDAAAAGALLASRVNGVVGARRVVVLIQSEDGLEMVADGRRAGADFTVSGDARGLSPKDLPFSLFKSVIDHHASACLEVQPSESDQDSETDGSAPLKGAVCLPLISRGVLLGLLYVETDDSRLCRHPHLAEFLACATQFAASAVDAIARDAAVSTSVATSNGLRTERDEAREVAQLLDRVGHGGTWRWATDSGSFAMSPELRAIVGLPMAGSWDMVSIWSLGVDDGAAVPVAVTQAVSDGAPFEIEYQIVRPDNDQIMTLLIMGAVAASGEQVYTGLAIDISAQVERRELQCAAAARTNRSSPNDATNASKSFSVMLANRLTSIMVDASAARSWLGRERPNIEAAGLAISQIQEMARSICDVMNRGSLLRLAA
ncbi:GAF domain-containing protein [Sphingobium sp. AP50]|uniref:GAF domain-containing protein n=1 Tax=Sphingobium sp. AP50 TaxID=1884369 RepID=UPI000B83D74D|nr:GAF domain-containing protein [Sphingobium sp. AP50]